MSLNMSISHGDRVNRVMSDFDSHSRAGAAHAFISELSHVANSANPAEKFKTNSHDLQIADQLVDEISINSLPENIRQARFSPEVESAKFLVGVLSGVINNSNNVTDIQELHDVVAMLPKLENSIKMQSKFTTMLHKLLVKFGQPAFDKVFAEFAEHCRDAWKHNTVGHDNNTLDQHIFSHDSMAIINQFYNKSSALINAKNWTDLACQAKYLKTTVVSLSKTLIYHKNNKKEAPTPPPRTSSARPSVPTPTGVNTDRGPFWPTLGFNPVNNNNPIISPVFNNYPGVQKSGDSAESDIKTLAGIAGKILKSDIEGQQKAALTGRLLDIIEGANNNKAFINKLKSVTSQDLTDKPQHNKSTETVSSLMSRGVNSQGEVSAAEARLHQNSDVTDNASMDPGFDAESAVSRGVNSQGEASAAEARLHQNSGVARSESMDPGIYAESAMSRGVNSQGEASAAEARLHQNSGVARSESMDPDIDAESAVSRSVNVQGKASAAEARLHQNSDVTGIESRDPGFDAESAMSRGVNSQGEASAAEARLHQNSDVTDSASMDPGFDAESAVSRSVNLLGEATAAEARLHQNSDVTDSASMDPGFDAESAVSRSVNLQGEATAARLHQNSGVARSESAEISFNSIDGKENGRNSLLNESLIGGIHPEKAIGRENISGQQEIMARANKLNGENKVEMATGSQKNVNRARIGTGASDKKEQGKNNNAFKEEYLQAWKAYDTRVREKRLAQRMNRESEAALHQNSGVARSESAEISFNSVDGKENGRNSLLNESLIAGIHQEKATGRENVSGQQEIMARANKLNGENKVEMVTGSQKKVNQARIGTGASDKKEQGKNTHDAFLKEILQAWQAREVRVQEKRLAQRIKAESVADVSTEQNKEETTIGSQENLSQSGIRTESPDRVELRRNSSTTPADGIHVQLTGRQFSLDSQARMKSVAGVTEQNEAATPEGALKNNQDERFDSQVELRNSNKAVRRPASHS